MSLRPTWSSTRSVLSVQYCTSTLPLTVVQPTRSSAGCNAANMIATASSVPVSTSRINLRLAMTASLAAFRLVVDHARRALRHQALGETLQHHLQDDADQQYADVAGARDPLTGQAVGQQLGRRPDHPDQRGAQDRAAVVAAAADDQHDPHQ